MTDLIITLLIIVSIFIFIHFVIFIIDVVMRNKIDNSTNKIEQAQSERLDKINNQLEYLIKRNKLNDSINEIHTEQIQSIEQKLKELNSKIK